MKSVKSIYSDFVTIVMVSSGTHIVKNHESPVQNHWVVVQKHDSLALYITTQLISRQTPKLCITVYWNKNILLVLSSKTKTKRNMRRWTIATDKNSHRNHTNRIFYENVFRSINRCLRPVRRIQQIILSLWEFLCVRDTGPRGNKITALAYSEA